MTGRDIEGQQTDPISSTQNNNNGIHYISIPISVVSNTNENSSNPNASDNNNNATYGSIEIRKNNNGNNGIHISRRGSIFDQPFGSFKGPNSLSRFASSFKRANSFKSVELHHDKERSFFKDGYDELYDPNTLAPSAHGRRLSLALSNSNLNGATNNRTLLQNQASISDLLSHSGNQTVFDDRDSAVSSLSPSVSGTSHVGYLNGIAANASSTNTVPFDSNSIVLKKVETKNGNVVTVLAGQSTAPQTVFNSVNVLIGIGLLALPLGMKYAGWVVGIPLLFLFAIATFCTAELLSRCLDTDPTLISYGDLGYAAFGAKGRALISLLFTFDLMGSGVSLFILFGDSLNALFPQYSVTFFKLIGFLIIAPQSFVPLSVLSNVSLLGIISTTGTVVVIFLSGLYKSTSPGSLINPMPTHLFPKSFNDFCLSIGLLSACWGGHAIFPNLKTDMRHPEKFKDCLKTTYSITSVTDIGTAILGFLMFGSSVMDEVTKSVLLTQGYPNFVYFLISALMAIIPIAKTPLNAMPIVSILDRLMGIHNVQLDFERGTFKYYGALFLGGFNKLMVNLIFLLVSIQLPAFDKLIAFIGAGLCFMICFILPCLFYLRICRERVKPWERVACHVTIVVSAVLAVLGIGAAIFH
ncbi:probable Vacuolar amino acid transporter 1 [Saccharomycodes ludwigii]|uniref:Probable Vacuolar amino acid transporter 1 n=1 Tax=Saccharomycodes ludwigii TaxID=36035 RepID=A0A376B661_9ASCO|nr:hypothetical protein SCDLUD_004668 [Saccharomycodes ludwigii]KAH3899235.1 hypothetical protein SCDLUD_004668 [Saccharomycodes ludwigii]SSD59590.1 probable Vacuolar amino acid transporter 1 [Saccharomycodes ludwigii]